MNSHPADSGREGRRTGDVLRLACADSRFGYESSNQYFYIPQDIREKILTCRQVLSALKD